MGFSFRKKKDDGVDPIDDPDVGEVQAGTIDPIDDEEEDAEDYNVEEALSVVEIDDETNGGVENSDTGGEEKMGADDNDNDAGTDDEAPPPPPLEDAPPEEDDDSQQLDGGDNDEPNRNTGGGRKKKLALAAMGVAGVAIVLGLGLGLGLKKDENPANSSNGDPNKNSGVDDIAAEDANTTTVSTVAAETDEDEQEPAAEVDTEATEAPPEATTEAPPEATTEAPPAEPVVTTVPAADDDPLADAPIYDAVIVGAGWAGLRALDVLMASEGIDDVILLEASDRVGGRSWSINSIGGSQNDAAVIGSAENIPHDLGAEWMYDADVNVQQDVLNEDGILGDGLWEDQGEFSSRPTAMEDGTTAYYRFTEADGTTAFRMENAKDWIEEVWTPFVNYREDNLDDLGGKSYGDAIDEYIEVEEWTDDEYLQFLNLLEDAKHLEHGTNDLDIAHDKFIDPTFQFDTVYMSSPGLGFGNVAAKYAESRMDRTSLGAKVTEINSSLDDDHAVVKYTENGAEKIVKARTVLVTVSVGVLKKGNIEFVPPLPEWKQGSIDAIGFGVTNKCVMSWNDQEAMVWPEDDMWILLATPDDESSGRWTTFSNPSKFKGVPSLTAWIGGNDAIAAESQSDEEILAAVMTNLRFMFPDITEPDNVYISRWGQEENVLGAYSYPSPGEDYYDDINNIAARLGKIYFAGEATSASGWATTFGAWDTGEEQALEIATRLQASRK